MKETGLICTGESVRGILADLKTQTRRLRGLEHINKNPNHWTLGKSPQSYESSDFAFLDMADPIGTYPTLATCPYGKVGDLLCCKEDYKYIIQGDLVLTYYKFSIGKNRVIYTPLNCLDEITRKRLIKGKQDVWKSKLLMFKFMTRIWLEITGIRIERVQEISEQDVKAEGGRYHKYTIEEEPNPSPEAKGYWFFESRRALHLGFGSAKAAFADLWDSINAKRGVCKTCKGHQIIPMWVGTPEGGNLMQSSQDCPDCDGETGYGWEKNPWVWVLEFKHAAAYARRRRKNNMEWQFDEYSLETKEEAEAKGQEFEEIAAAEKTLLIPIEQSSPKEKPNG